MASKNEIDGVFLLGIILFLLSWFLLVMFACSVALLTLLNQTGTQFCRITDHQNDP